APAEPAPDRRPVGDRDEAGRVWALDEGAGGVAEGLPLARLGARAGHPVFHLPLRRETPRGRRDHDERGRGEVPLPVGPAVPAKATPAGTAGPTPSGTRSSLRGTCAGPGTRQFSIRATPSPSRPVRLPSPGSGRRSGCGYAGRRSTYRACRR